jgi:hypothetical protein
MCENAAWIGPKGTILLSDDQDDLQNTVPKISFKIAAAVATLDLLAMIFSNRLDWIEPIVRVAKGFKHFWKTTCDLEYNFQARGGHCDNLLMEQNRSAGVVRVSVTIFEFRDPNKMSDPVV